MDVIVVVFRAWASLQKQNEKLAMPPLYEPTQCMFLHLLHGARLFVPWMCYMREMLLDLLLKPDMLTVAKLWCKGAHTMTLLHVKLMIFDGADSAPNRGYIWEHPENYVYAKYYYNIGIR